jgi:hypothetical protein
MKKIVILITFSIILLSCKKDLWSTLNETPDQYYHLPISLLKISDFKKGSYWVYHNDSLKIDNTIKVINYRKSEDVEHIDNFEVHYDKITITLSSSYKVNLITDELSCNTTYGEYKRSYSISENSGDFKIGNFTIGSLITINNYYVNEVLYPSVMEFSSNDNKFKYYFADYVGVVKYTTFEYGKTFVWELVNYKIVN